MSIKETLQRLVAGKPKEKQITTPEAQRKTTIRFLDLRKEEIAKEKGLDPGYYLAVYPILPADLKNDMLLHELSFPFLEKLRAEGLFKGSDTRIYTDTKAKTFVDPALTWEFSPAAYIDNMQILIVRADSVNRDEAQQKIITILANK
jgi:hypothetical protein